MSLSVLWNDSLSESVFMAINGLSCFLSNFPNAFSWANACLDDDGISYGASAVVGRVMPVGMSLPMSSIFVAWADVGLFIDDAIVIGSDMIDL